jgi:hypothetical protein
VSATLIATIGFGLWRWIGTDSDGDGLPDRVEASGWVTADGAEHRTDPDRADSDGDGLTDLDEAGAPVTTGESEDVYSGYSDPLRADTDGDDLIDGAEANLGLDPQDRDSDDDNLRDGYEVDVVSTAPDVADTDGDGFNDGYEDANRDSQGLDPLSADVEIDKLTYVADFAKGALAGDLWREDSLAWLSGNLASGGASSIPVVGQAVGGAGDLRDAIGSAIKGDWVGSGFSALGLVPLGDAIAVPAKAAKFIERNPRLAAQAASLIAKSSVFPDAVKLKAARYIWPSWDELVRAGASEKALLQLQRGRTDLNDLAAVLQRSTHVPGPASGPFPTGRVGEQHLEAQLGAKTKGLDWQVRASTAGCTDKCNSSLRIFDVLVDGIAHESKVGLVPLSAAIQSEIRKDAWLIKDGQIRGAHWHFYPSSASNTLGANPAVLDLLDELHIPYTLHLPAGG